MAGKEQGANLVDYFFQKLLTTLTALTSSCVKCSAISPSKAAALGKSVGSMGSARKIWHFTFWLLSLCKLTISGFVSKSFAASKIYICYMSLPAFVLCTSMQHQYSDSSQGHLTSEVALANSSSLLNGVRLLQSKVQRKPEVSQLHWSNSAQTLILEEPRCWWHFQNSSAAPQESIWRLVLFSILFHMVLGKKCICRFLCQLCGALLPVSFALTELN